MKTTGSGGQYRHVGAHSSPPNLADEVTHTLDAAGWTRFSTKIFLIAGLGWMGDGAESAVMSYMLPSLLQRWSLTESELGSVGSLIAAGQALGAFFWGAFADVIGRRTAFLFSVGMTAVLGMISAAAPDITWYIVLRFATGFAIGGNLPLAIAVASELLPPKFRDRALVALHLFYEAGAMCSTGLALWLMPASCADDSPCAWRSYLLLVAAPAAVVLPVAVLRLPESPYWLASQGREKALHIVLAQARQSAATEFQPLTEPNESDYDAESLATKRGTVQETVPDPEKPSSCSHAWARCRELFLFRSTSLVCAIWLFADMASGWWTWTPTFAAMQSVSAMHIYRAALIGRVIASGSFVLATFLIDRIGARRLLVGTLFATTILSAALTAWTLDPARFAATSFLIVYGAFALCFGGTWPVMYVVTPQAFPVSVRGAGFGLASSAGKVGTLLGPLVVGQLAPSISKIGTFFTVGWATDSCKIVIRPAEDCPVLCLP